MSERTNGDTLRVAVAGVNGRMGRVAHAAITTSQHLSFAGGLARHENLPDRLYADLATLLREERPDVLVDCTLHPASVGIALACVHAGVRPVVGVSGWTPEELTQLDAAARSRGIGAMHIPNFALGAVLMMRFATSAARFFPTAEIIELHHDAKRDAPSGTARATAAKITEVTKVSPPIHSVRLRGLVAHQEVLFGGEGEVLTIRHDSLSRESFAAGILLAIERVTQIVGAEFDLEPALGFAETNQ